ncbi:hypothetical protein BP6252_02993 [Coleophoma cylindrospora]|uniref:tetrahydrofolate synthase n=1 Tax=Coleophoma cylindrospora TaxID=1849047 RepID=A0A3D8S729_9HELO|nr:hypothetical protein BP6252_02993 [Coleophoma cylindrospora]
MPSETEVAHELAIVRSKDQIPVPSTDLLSYLFDSPYSEHNQWPSDEPLFLSPPGSEYPNYTFEEIKKLVKCFATGLKRLGSKGKRVAIYGDSNVHFQIVLLGALAAGASVNLCPSCPVQDLAFRVQQLEADFVFFSSDEIDKAYAAAADSNIPKERLFAIDHSTEKREAQGNDQSWSSIFDFKDGSSFEWQRLSDEESKNTTALYVYTSGSTGSPKLAERSHYGLIGNTEQLLFRYNRTNRTKGSVFCSFKAAGIGGILFGLLTPLKTRYKSMFVGQCDLKTYIGLVESFRPTYLAMPKYMVQELVDHAPKADFSSVTEITVGGAMVPFKLREMWAQVHGSPCYVVMGMTEVIRVGVQISSNPLRPVTDNTLGQLLPNVEAMVVDRSGQPVQRNQCGELWTKDPFRMKGYLNNALQTAEMFTDDGWLRSGDICKVNEQDDWYFIGRIKDLFKIKGNHVSASEIESALLNHSSIIDASVIPVKVPGDEESVPRGFLVKDQSSELTLENLYEWMDKDLAPKMQLLGGAEFLDVLPLSNRATTILNSKRQKCDHDRNPEIYGQPMSSLMKEGLQVLGYTDRDINHLNVIHVAGTKGKGSTCAFTNCFLKAHGERTGYPRKTGLYTGPHLVCLRERLRINFEPIDEELFATYFFDVWEKFLTSRLTPGYLQLMTLVSFHAFVKEGVDVAIFETNCGGEDDATNFFMNPAVTGITRLGLDHIKTLGPTIQNIAWHKSGIFKPGAPALSTIQEQVASDELQRRAAEKNTVLEFVDIDPMIPANVIPEVQKKNATLGMALVNASLKNRPVNESRGLIPQDVVRGVELYSWPGRFEHIVDGHYQWLLDMAHNALSLRAAGKWFVDATSESQSNNSNLPNILIFSQVSERDHETLLKNLAKSIQDGHIKFQYVIFCTLLERQDDIPSNDLAHRNLESVSSEIQESYAAIWKGIDSQAEISLEPTINDALQSAKTIGTQAGGMQTLITGTSRLVGHALCLLHRVDS